MPGAQVVTGWGRRQTIADLFNGQKALWISNAVELPVVPSESATTAGLNVGVSAAGLTDRCIGLFAEVSFATDNPDIHFVDTVILGKIGGLTEGTPTPYHALSDNHADREAYSTGRPEAGTLSPANQLAQFVIGAVAEMR